MALIKCSECGHDVSDKAKTCPHCGAPVEIGLKSISIPYTINAKEHPSEGARYIGKLFRDDKIRLDSERGEWYRFETIIIRSSKFTSGWIKKSEIDTMNQKPKIHHRESDVSKKSNDVGKIIKSLFTIGILIALGFVCFNFPDEKVSNDTSSLPEVKFTQSQKSLLTGTFGIFEDIGYYKKNRTRIFSVYTSSVDFTKIEEYAKNKPYTSGRVTMVYFFNDKSNTPDVTFIGGEFDKKYEKYCIAMYGKFPNGSEQFGRYPFKE